MITEQQDESDPLNENSISEHSTFEVALQSPKFLHNTPHLQKTRKSVLLFRWFCRWKRQILGVVLHLALLFCLVIATYFIPSTTLNEDSLLAQYIENSHFPWSTFVLWIILQVFGYTFVSSVTEQRKNPFKSRYNTYREFVKLIVVAPLIFFLGPVFTLAGPHLAATYSTEFTVNILFAGFTPFTMALVYNFFCYILFFYFGLHWTYFDKNEFLRNVGDKFVSPSRWKTYRKSEFIVLCIICFCCLLPLISLNVFLVIESRLILFLGVGYLVVIFVLACVTFLIRKNYEWHLHHYFHALLYIPLTRFLNPLSAAFQGFCAGVYVEGVSCWSMASLWDRRSQSSSSSSSSSSETPAP